MRYLTPFMLVVVVLAATGCGGSGSSSAVEDCQLAGSDGVKGPVTKVDGRTLVRATGNDCVVADGQATVVARGEAIVAAHGQVAVDAGDNATVVVYNNDVRCHIRGPGVTVVNAVQEGWFDTPNPDISCRQKP